MDFALQVSNLCKSYKNTDFELKNISFNIPKGSIVGLVGKNGAGKSTTINTILNITHKNNGKVVFFGQEILETSKLILNDIGVVFDSSHFSGELTPNKLEKIMNDIYIRWDRALFFSYLERFHISSNSKIKTFSRGMTMKLSISIALSHNASLLILDEPTTGFDPVVREELLDMLLEFVENETNSILISSHITSDLEKVADYITFIDNGKIILTEKKDTLIYEYGIARMKQSEFDNLEKTEYLAWRIRGLQTEVIIQNKNVFSKRHPHIMIDNATIDELLPSIGREGN